MKPTAKNVLKHCDTSNLTKSERDRQVWTIDEFLNCERLSAEDRVCNAQEFRLFDEPLLTTTDRRTFCVAAATELGVYLTDAERSALNMARDWSDSGVETPTLEMREAVNSLLPDYTSISAGHRSYAVYALYEATSQVPLIDCCATAVLDCVNEEENSPERQKMAERLLEKLKVIVAWRVSLENEYRDSEGRDIQ